MRADHAQLVVEIVSPTWETTDEVDKLGEYARAGIPHYWIVRLDASGVSVIERYRLVLQRHFVTAQSVTMDVTRPPPDDPKVCGQQKIVRWPLASA